MKDNILYELLSRNTDLFSALTQIRENGENEPQEEGGNNGKDTEVKPKVNLELMNLSDALGDGDKSVLKGNSKYPDFKALLKGIKEGSVTLSFESIPPKKDQKAVIRDNTVVSGIRSLFLNYLKEFYRQARGEDSRQTNNEIYYLSTKDDPSSVEDKDFFAKIKVKDGTPQQDISFDPNTFEMKVVGAGLNNNKNVNATVEESTFKFVFNNVLVVQMGDGENSVEFLWSINRKEDLEKLFGKSLDGKSEDCIIKASSKNTIVDLFSNKSTTKNNSQNSIDSASDNALVFSKYEQSAIRDAVRQTINNIGEIKMRLNPDYSYDPKNPLGAMEVGNVEPSVSFKFTPSEEMRARLVKENSNLGTRPSSLILRFREDNESVVEGDLNSTGTDLSNNSSSGSFGGDAVTSAKIERLEIKIDFTATILKEDCRVEEAPSDTQQQPQKQNESLIKLFGVDSLQKLEEDKHTIGNYMDSLRWITMKSYEPVDNNIDAHTYIGIRNGNKTQFRNLDNKGNPIKIDGNTDQWTKDGGFVKYYTTMFNKVNKDTKVVDKDSNIRDIAASLISDIGKARTIQGKGISTAVNGNQEAYSEYYSLVNGIDVGDIAFDLDRESAVGNYLDSFFNKNPKVSRTLKADIESLEKYIIDLKTWLKGIVEYKEIRKYEEPKKPVESETANGGNNSTKDNRRQGLVDAVMAVVGNSGAASTSVKSDAVFSKKLIGKTSMTLENINLIDKVNDGIAASTDDGNKITNMFSPALYLVEHLSDKIDSLEIEKKNTPGFKGKTYLMWGIPIGKDGNIPFGDVKLEGNQITGWFSISVRRNLEKEGLIKDTYKAAADGAKQLKGVLGGSGLAGRNLGSA